MRYLTTSFASINHDVLKGKLLKVFEKRGLDMRIYDLLCIYIDKTEGLPLGYQTSQLFALLMLDALDHYIEEERGFRFHVRGMDDFVVIGRHKEDLVKLLKDIKREAGENRPGAEQQDGHFPQCETAWISWASTPTSPRAGAVSAEAAPDRHPAHREAHQEVASTTSQRGKFRPKKSRSASLSWDSHAAYGETRELRKKYAKEVSDIIGEPVEIHRKLNSTRIQRERRRAKQQRCITAKRQRSLARQAAYRSPDLPPWE